VNEDTIVQFSASGTGRTILLVSAGVKFIRKFAGDHPQRGGGLKWGTLYR